MGLYDAGAKCIIWIALRESGMPSWLALQHLDDLVGVGPAGYDWAQKFYEVYLSVCDRIGVSLASTDDKDKAFPPSTRGLVLGILFCTVDWIWWLPEDKLIRIICSINALEKEHETDLRTVWSVVGKILYVKELVAPGKYHISDLLRMYISSKDPNARVKVTDPAREQLKWWSMFLPLCGRSMPIPSGYDLCPPWAKEGDSDAAGGSMETAGKGMGVVVGKKWTYFPWPKLINSNAIAPCCGKRWRCKLTFLELNGHMARVCGFPEDCLDSTICTNIDNI